MEANPLRRVLTAKATAFVGLALLVAVVVGIISVASVSKNSEAAPQPVRFGAKEVIDSNGGLPLTGTYKSKGGRLIISAAGSGWSSNKDQLIGMKVLVDSTQVGTAQVWTNEADSHKAFVSVFPVVYNEPRGTVTIKLEELNAQTTTDENDHYRVTVVELPKR